jgi:hypothetical protein
MSGPKTGTWHFVRTYDPTEDRLDDLRRFAANQAAWLARNGGFIRRQLGDKHLAMAQAALDVIQQYIAAEDPDSGFDAYGKAWSLLHALYRQAGKTREEQQRQERLRREAMLAKQQEQMRRKEEQAKRERAAAAEAVNGCKEAWGTPEHQALLGRWADSGERTGLATDFLCVGTGSPELVRRKTSAWQERFDRMLATARRRAEENARAVTRSIPVLRSVLQGLGALNTPVLPSRDRSQFEEQKTRLHQRAEAALSAEDLPALQAAIQGLRKLATESQPGIKAAELKKASQAWRDALARCGYSVVSRTGPDGTVILQASSFPTKTLSVEVRPDSEEVKLEVGSKHDHVRCVKDVQTLQAELARQGVQLTMTDWGAGKPGTIETLSSQSISTGGAR